MSIQNIGMGLGPILVSVLHDSTSSYKHGFFAVNILNAFEAAIALVLAFFLYKYDKDHW